jgi:hypothetical protein
MKINQVWTKRKFILLVCACCLLSAFSSYAQTLRFHVVDAQTHHALDNVLRLQSIDYKGDERYL